MILYENGKSFFLLVLLSLLMCSCGTEGYEPEKDQEEEEIVPTAPVPPDATLEAVTWNLNWYGDDTYGEESGSGNGPANEQLQVKNIVEVLDSLQADLYALQEVHGQQALSDLTERMSGYRGFVAGHIDWIQKTAFVYNTQTIDSLEAGGILEDQGQDSHAWASGRFPLYFRFIYTFEQQSQEFYAIVIHAKANDDEESYGRRRDAALDLYGYLQEEHPEARILLLGDYNDDVDVSIYEEQETPYQPFKEDPDFRILTEVLSTAGHSSTTNTRYSDLIDHITISDELYPLYIEESAVVFKDPEEFIPAYSSTTTDHFPVWARFDVTRRVQ